MLLFMGKSIMFFPYSPGSTFSKIIEIHNTIFKLPVLAESEYLFLFKKKKGLVESMRSHVDEIIILNSTVDGC